MKYNDEKDMISYFEKAFSDDRLSLELSNENSSFFFAYLDQQLAGYLKVNCGKAQTDLQEQNSLEVERIYVLKKFQGKRVGYQLFETALELAKEEQVDFIWLGVWEENRRAIEFYRKLGFTKFDNHVFMLGDDPQMDVLMKRDTKSHLEPL